MGVARYREKSVRISSFEMLSDLHGKSISSGLVECPIFLDKSELGGNDRMLCLGYALLGVRMTGRLAENE